MNASMIRYVSVFVFFELKYQMAIPVIEIIYVEDSAR